MKKPNQKLSATKKNPVKKQARLPQTKLAKAPANRLIPAKSTVSNSFPVVGIGASAGGLEAVSGLLKKLPSNTGAALVIIQHLDPAHESLTAEILSRITKMPVGEAKEGTAIEPNHVYVIPPNSNLSVQSGLLRLSPRISKKGPQLPINFFFESLAADRKDRAVGVVLSGTGTDGTQGLIAIKSENGLAFAQEPKSARFGDMPNNAIASGAVDLVLSLGGIAEEIAKFAHNLSHSSEPTASSSHSNSEQPLEGATDPILRKIFSLVYEQTQVDFTHYKRTTILRRISRRKLILKIKSLAQYARFLERNIGEVHALFSDILIHVTSFFRDADVFEALKLQILRKLSPEKSPCSVIRVWVAGCSTGEEAYSMAILLLECLESCNKVATIQIFASDVSESAIQKARSGYYDELLVGISKQRREKFFDKVPKGYRVKKKVRELCVFSKHDVACDPPFAKVDLISCRNLLIYFDDELQKRILPIFHYSLNKGGLLLLGKSESIGSYQELFSPLNKLQKVFQKLEVKTPREAYIPIRNVVAAPNDKSKLQLTSFSPQQPLIQKELERIVLRNYAPPSIVINEAMDILQILGNVTPFISFPSGQASLNLMRVARAELVPDLRKLLLAVKKRENKVKKSGFKIIDSGETIYFDIKVEPLPTSASRMQKTYAIFFEKSANPDLSAYRALQSNLKTRKHLLGKSKEKNHTSILLELQNIKARQEHLQALNEEFETSQEELTAANEELQSTNEELQSTNEEMETAREELQSSNEELTTVNDELQAKNLELSHVSGDLVGLLNSAEIPLILVDADCRIRRFNSQTEKHFKILPGDIGRNIGDLKPDLLAGNLAEISKKVIQTAAAMQLETQDHSGHWYHLIVKPYRKVNESIDGAVISLLDIQQTKEAIEVARLSDRKLAAANVDATKILEANPIPILLFGANRKVFFANHAFFHTFRLIPAHVLDKTVEQLESELWKNVEITAKINKTLSDGTEYLGLEMESKGSNSGPTSLLLYSRKIQLAGSGTDTVLLLLEDISAKKAAEWEKTKILSLLQQLSSRVPGLVYQYLLRSDGTSCFPYASDGIREIYRVNPEDVREDASKVLAVLHPDDSKVVMDSIRKSATEMHTWSLEYRVKFADGTVRWLQGNSSPQKIGNGSVLWHGFIADITERKNAEFALKESEEKYRTLVMSAYDGIMVVRDDSTIEVANPQLCMMFDYEESELLNKNFEMLIPVRDRTKHLPLAKQFLETPHSREMGKGLNIFGRRKDGSEFPIDVSLSPFHSNAKLFINCVIRDISKLKEIERERLQILDREKAAREQAEAANKTKDEFLAILSHELRTPLTTILTWTQLLRRGVLDSEKTRHGLEILEMSAKAQGQLINDLLDISRIQAGKLFLDIQPIDPQKIINESVDSLRSLAAAKDLRIEIQLDPAIKTIHADPMRFQQILWNLVTNAVKFSAQNGQIWISLEQAKREGENVIRIQVKDNGRGIRPDFMPMLFERFTQIDSTTTRSYGGLGLGLAIVKKLAEMHGGTVVAESEGEGKGATFSVFLPALAETSAAQKISAPSAFAEDASADSLKGLKVLLVDDEANAREVLALALQLNGAVLKTANSAREALVALESFEPDVLVSDIGMPVEDGYILMKKVRALPSKFAKVPAIALTAFAGQNDIQRCLSAGFQAHLAKPIDVNGLAQAIADVAKKV